METVSLTASLQRDALRRKSLAILVDIAHWHVCLQAQLLTEALERHAKAGFSPDQPRDDHGRWTGEGGGGSTNEDDTTGPEGMGENPLVGLLAALGIGSLEAADSVVALFDSAGTEAAATETSTVVRTEWKLGSYKSSQRWANQIADRHWTPDEITDTIANGEAFPAPNNVNKGNTATRYQLKYRFVVRDDQTLEILQISGENFEPAQLSDE